MPVSVDSNGDLTIQLSTSFPSVTITDASPDVVIGTEGLQGPMGNSVWGGIQGDPNNQTDIINLINARDPLGAADQAIANHESLPDPHPQYMTQGEVEALLDGSSFAPLVHEHGISGINGLQTALNNREMLGSADAAIANHESLLDPHPQYIDTTELNAAIASIPPAPVQSVFGRSGDVIAQSGDYNSDQVPEGSTNLYLTSARSRSYLSASPPLSYDSTLGIFSLPAASDSQDGYFSSANFSKLAGIQSGATANSTDAFLLSRANHTGSQPVSTISDSTAVGRSLVTATDAAAARTAISAPAKPAISTLNAIARYADTSGNLANSSATIDDSGNVAIAGALSAATAAFTPGSLAQQIRIGANVSNSVFAGIELQGPLAYNPPSQNKWSIACNASGHLTFMTTPTTDTNSVVAYWTVNSGLFMQTNLVMTNGGSAPIPRIQVGGSNGLYNAVANTISVAANGVESARFSSTGINIPLTTASTSTTTGALTVTGGAGFGGAVYVGGRLNLPTGSTSNGISINAGSGRDWQIFASNATNRLTITDTGASTVPALDLGVGSVKIFPSAFGFAWFDYNSGSPTLQVGGHPSHTASTPVFMVGRNTASPQFAINGDSSVRVVNTLYFSTATAANFDWFNLGSNNTASVFKLRRNVSGDGSKYWNAFYSGYGDLVFNVAPASAATDANEILRLTYTSAAIASTTASTSTTTGAFVVGGGAGFAGAINVGGNAAIAGRVTQGAPNTAPTDTNLSNSQLSFWIDEATSTLKVRIKFSDGTLKTGTITLA